MASRQFTEAEQRIKKALSTKATTLDLSCLNLETLPTSIRQRLFNLKQLNLSNNQLKTVPKELGQLFNLRQLNLSSNQLKTVPKELGQLSNLKQLNLSSNQLKTVPKELGQLSDLRQINLSNNQLTTVPMELGQLSNLRYLNLNANPDLASPPLEVIEKGPEKILSYYRLVEQRIQESLYTNILDLSKLALLAIPKSIGKLSNLKQVNLGNNQLTTIPKELGQLSKLKHLDLHNNQLTTVPKFLGQLSNLRQINLSNNKLTAVPKELGQLSKLKHLDLRLNQLMTVPKELGQLSHLERLDLRLNQLMTVPKELGQLSNLTSLYLSANPNLQFPPPEVMEQGTQAVLAYMQEQQNNGENQWISKLLVVGEGGVGKTSLLRALRGESFEVQQSSTHGIEIKALKLEHPSKIDVTMTLNTWDFGGQEIYHATHQFFLTNRSLFLLAFNARLGFEQGKLIYWLKTIRANAPDSPIILVSTWSDERDADLPLSELKEQFPQIVDLYEVSNKTGHGINVLKQTITSTAAKLPLMGELWPTTWLTFATKIRQINSKQATTEQFWSAMDKCKVSDESKAVLAKWMHELGDILFFQDNPNLNDLVILKPQWVTEYISKVLSAEDVITNFGIFTRQCMNELWKELPLGLREYFLELMEQFDLSYKIPDDPEDKSLVVERLDYEPPSFQALWKQKRKEPNYKEISMKFQLSEILAGIPTWFIARQHRFTQNLHWRTGVLFGDSRTNPKHLGLLRVNRDTRTNADHVTLTVRGPMPHNFFGILREGFELTLSRYPGLQITCLIPCPDPLYEDCKHEFDYANLTKRLERTPPRETIDCEQCLETISVTQLLFGIHYTTQDAVIKKIDKLQASNQENFDNLQDTVEEGFTELRELVQRDLIREIRTVQKQLESPCPSIFVLRPDDRKPWQKNIGSQRINLQLYCEHPGCLHPVQDGGLYPIDHPKKWLNTMAPHINRLFGILKYVTPVMGPWINLSAPIYSELIENDLALTEALIDKLPNIQFDHDDRSFIDDERGDGPNKISGAALRTLHQFLKQKDPEQVWGDLTRTTTPEGDVLWLCKEHIKEIYPTSS